MKRYGSLTCRSLFPRAAVHAYVSGLSTTAPLMRLNIIGPATNKACYKVKGIEATWGRPSLPTDHDPISAVRPKKLVELQIQKREPSRQSASSAIATNISIFLRWKTGLCRHLSDPAVEAVTHLVTHISRKAIGWHKKYNKAACTIHHSDAGRQIRRRRLGVRKNSDGD